VQFPRPIIDRLAQEGNAIDGTGHSSSGVCSPSRYDFSPGGIIWAVSIAEWNCGSLGRAADSVRTDDACLVGKAA